MYLDPNIIQAARKVYRSYLSIYVRIPKKPQGVVLNQQTFRGQLVFKERPVLLPGEFFIPMAQIEARML